MKSGAELIADERRRQIEVEGWSPEHDDQWTGCQLVQAAKLYACAGAATHLMHHNDLHAWPFAGAWPCGPDWWKPSTDPIRNLVKAGALIAAEIDRIQREEEE